MTQPWRTGDKVAVSENGAWWDATVVSAHVGELEIKWDDRYAWWHSASERVDLARVRARSEVSVKRPARRALLVAVLMAVIGLGVVAVVVQPWKRGNYLQGQSVEIEWQGAWHAGSILELKDGRYLVHYDGFDDSWNEVVDASRLRTLR